MAGAGDRPHGLKHDKTEDHMKPAPMNHHGWAGHDGGNKTPGNADAGGKWMQGAVKHPGALHRALHVPQGEKIPAGKLAVKEGDSPTMVKRKTLAKTFKKFGGK